MEATVSGRLGCTKNNSQCWRSPATPFVTSSISLSDSNPAPGESITATVNFQNTGDLPANVGLFKVAVRDKNGGNFDFPGDTITIAPHSTYAYSESRSFPASGTYSAYTTTSIVAGTNTHHRHKAVQLFAI